MSLPEFVNEYSSSLLWVPHERVLEQADNGDIILLASPNKVIEFFAESPFTHVCLVFRDYETKGCRGNRIPYAWDADVGQKSRAGPRVMRLEDKLKRYRGGRFCAWKRLQGRRPPTTQFLSVLPSYFEYDIDVTFVRWFLCRVLARVPCASVRRLQAFLDPSHLKLIFCSELIALTLQKFGILQKHVSATAVSPGDCYENRLCLEDNYGYGSAFFFSRVKKKRNHRHK